MSSLTILTDFLAYDGTVTRTMGQISRSESVWIDSAALLTLLKHKVFRSYSQALPIHAKSRREWGPENACSFTVLRMANFSIWGENRFLK